ncbi:hypothetical protein [Streptomyces melanogenes]|uniref:hypothetical protein n=1 Tax=Streptomyces melanogenes TaxID=67326 RepID=UPI00378D7702
MLFLRCEVVGWVGAEPWPGLVEVSFVDVHRQQWTLVDKWPVFSSEDLHRDSCYPVVVGILCDILGSGHSSEFADVVRISVAPWGLESLDGCSEFEVRADQLITG